MLSLDSEQIVSQIPFEAFERLHFKTKFSDVFPYLLNWGVYGGIKISSIFGGFLLTLIYAMPLHRMPI